MRNERKRAGFRSLGTISTKWILITVVDDTPFSRCAFTPPLPFPPERRCSRLFALPFDLPARRIPSRREPNLQLSKFSFSLPPSLFYRVSFPLPPLFLSHFLFRCFSSLSVSPRPPPFDTSTSDGLSPGRFYFFATPRRARARRRPLARKSNFASAFLPLPTLFLRFACRAVSRHEGDR